MGCAIYLVNVQTMRRRHITNIVRHTDMPEWLRDYGEPQYIYEIWKGSNIHSRWCWKEKPYKPGKWGRMPTPRG